MVLMLQCFQVNLQIATPLESVGNNVIDKNAQTLLNEYGRLNSDSFERNSKIEAWLQQLKMLQINGHQIGCNSTKTGHTARLISKYRPNADIPALTFDELTERD